MSTNPFWDLIQLYMDDPRHRYKPLAADIARECDLSPQLLSKWKKKPMLPAPEQLIKLSTGTRITYPRLLEAALQGKGYFVGGPARVVTSDFLDAADEEAFAFEAAKLPFARALSRNADAPGSDAEAISSGRAPELEGR